MKLIGQIQSGKRPAPRRVMLYGTHGVGKSTFGAMSDKPIFIQTEDGLGEIDCDRFPLAETFDQAIAALSELYSEKHAYAYLYTQSDWGQYVPTGGPYSTSVWLYAGCMRFNTAAYKGKTLYKIRVSCAYYRKNTACEFRITYQTNAGTVPDNSWAWTTASPYVIVPGTGSSVLTLGTPLTLDDTLWLTSWMSDYTPPTNASLDNFFRVDSPVRLYFQE